MRVRRSVERDRKGGRGGEEKGNSIISINLTLECLPVTKAINRNHNTFTLKRISNLHLFHHLIRVYGIYLT